MKKLFLCFSIFLLSQTYTWGWISDYWNPVSTLTVCNDGTYSSSVGSGTCSWHGGVAKSPPSFPSTIGLENSKKPAYLSYNATPYSYEQPIVYEDGYQYQSTYQKIEWLQYGNYKDYGVQIFNAKGGSIYNRNVGTSHHFNPSTLNLKPGLYTWKATYKNSHNYYIFVDLIGFEGQFVVEGYVSEYEYVQWESDPDVDYCIDLCDNTGTPYPGLESIECGTGLSNFSPKTYIEIILNIDVSDFSGFIFKWSVRSDNEIEFQGSVKIP